MKRILNYVLLPVLFALLIVIAAIAVFFLLNYLNRSFQLFINDEMAIYRALFHDTKGFFPYSYRLHTRMLYLLALLGVVFILKMIWKICKPLVSKVFQRTKHYKSLYPISLLFFFFVFFIAGILFFTENQLRAKNHFPGCFYKGNNFAPENPSIQKYLIADERGMTFYDYDSLVSIKYPAHFILNRQGFPNAFDFNRNTVDSLCSTGPKRKKKILFIGDSFLQGQGASDFGNCFAEIYRANHSEQLVCSAGIPGSDPVEYRLCAEKFIPELLPEEICVFFYGYNDAITVDRKPFPFMPQYTAWKESGVIDNYLPISYAGNGDSIVPAEETYRRSRQQYSLFGKTDWVTAVCSQSSVTTRLYYLFNPPDNPPKIEESDSSATFRNLQKIKVLSDSVGATFSIVFVPTPQMKNFGIKEYEQHFGWAFKDLWSYVHFPPKGFVEEQDCVSDVDYHFNDSGQRKYAGFLETVLQTKK